MTFFLIFVIPAHAGIWKGCSNNSVGCSIPSLRAQRGNPFFPTVFWVDLSPTLLAKTDSHLTSSFPEFSAENSRGIYSITSASNH
jgi:hypothetical protein